MKLTKAQIQKYIENGGVKCLFCKSPDIQGDSIEIDAGVAWQDIECLKCGKTWTDIYKLWDITIKEEE